MFPEFVPSQVDIQTEAPGFSPQQVEELVTKHSRERRQRRIRTRHSAFGVHSGTLRGHHHICRRCRCAYCAAGNLRAAVRNSAAALPAGVGVPKLSPLVSSTMDLLKIGLLSDKVDAYALRDTADWVIKPRLLAVPGVAHVIVFGGNVRQIQIQPDMRRLASFGITLTDVADAAEAALPLRGAGFIDHRQPARAPRVADSRSPTRPPSARRSSRAQ